MQEQDGSMTMLDAKKVDELSASDRKKIVSVRQVFKIRQSYFQITDITPEGITAKGISRRDYFDLKGPG